MNIKIKDLPSVKNPHSVLKYCLFDVCHCLRKLNEWLVYKSREYLHCVTSSDVFVVSLMILVCGMANQQSLISSVVSYIRIVYNYTVKTLKAELKVNVVLIFNTDDVNDLCTVT